MAMEKFDVCVIGAGPGGYVAAIKAGQKGLKTALIEKSNFGGTCLNIGCIPTKTLIASAEVLHSARHAADFGVEITGEIKPNWTKMLKRKDDVLDKLRGGIAGLLKAAGVTVFKGSASFMDRKSVMISGGDNAGTTIEAKNFITYLKTKMFRSLVLASKTSQDLPSKTYRFVPMQDFSKAWTDAELYAKYGLTEEEIAFIETMIKPME